MAYSEFHKMTALELVERAGGEITPAVMAEIRAALDAPKLNQSTVWRWVQQAHATAPPPNAKMQTAKKTAAQIVTQKLDDMFEDAARRFVAHAVQPEQIAQLDSAKAMTAAGIAVDKMRLLRDMPTEIIKLWPGFVEAAEALGRTPADVFNAFIQQTAALKAQRGDDDDADRHPSGGSA